MVERDGAEPWLLVPDINFCEVGFSGTASRSVRYQLIICLVKNKSRFFLFRFQFVFVFRYFIHLFFCFCFFNVGQAGEGAEH